ncbi:MAG: hypothetical protein DHS20C02_00670 [Micavibrio sp.]|nr:MAG: hypothetical protein DHS20C02_00670 [Micavibrio sp.]
MADINKFITIDKPSATATTEERDPALEQGRETAVSRFQQAATGLGGESYEEKYDQTVLHRENKFQDEDYEDKPENAALRQSLLRASVHTYEMMKGKPPPQSMSDDEVINYGMEFMMDYETGLAEWSTELINPLNWFNSDDIGGSIGVDRKAEKATPEQKEALRYLKDVYDKYDASNIEFVLETLAAPENILMLPAGFLGKGLQIGWNVAKGGLSAIKSSGIRAAVSSAKTAAGPVSKTYGAAMGLVEGTSFAAIDAKHRLDTDVTIGREKEFRTDLFAQQVVMGGAFGALGPVVIPKVVSWTGGKLGSVVGGVKKAGNKVRSWYRGAPSGLITSDKIIAAPERSWMHTAVWAAGLPRRMLPPWKTGDPSDWLPNDLAMGKYMHAFIHAIDDKILDSRHNMNEIVSTLEAQLEKVARRAERNEIDATQAKKECADLVDQFRLDNETKLGDFAKSLDSIVDEIELERDLAKVTELARKAEKGIDPDEAGARATKIIDDWEASQAAKGTGLTLSLEQRIAYVTNAKNGGKGSFRLEHRQADAMYRYVLNIKSTAEKLSDIGSGFGTQYSKEFDDILGKNIDESAVGKAIRKSLWDIKKLTGNANQEKSANAFQRDQDKAIYNWKRFVPKTLGGNWKMRKNKIEDIDALMRMFDVGYYNSNRRIADIIEFPDRDNSERFAILIEMAHELQEVISQKKSVTEYLDGQARTVYGAGREWEYIKAIQRLQWMTGRGEENKIPQGLSNMLGSEKDRPDVKAIRITQGTPEAATAMAHFDEFLGGVAFEEAWMGHSPFPQFQRHVLDLFVRMSHLLWHGKRFAGEGEIAVPFMDMFVVQRARNWWAETKAYLSGGYTSPSVDPKNPAPRVLWLPELGKDEKRGWELAARAKVVTKLLWNWATLPIRPAILVTKPLFTNTAAKKTAIALGAGGTALAAIEGTIEGTMTPEKETWITNEEGNLVVPFTNTDLDVGNRTTELLLDIVDLGLSPLRGYTAAGRNLWNSDPVQKMVKKKLGKAAPLNLEVEDYFSTDAPGLSLMEFNKHYLGDRGETESRLAAAELKEDMRMAFSIIGQVPPDEIMDDMRIAKDIIAGKNPQERLRETRRQFKTMSQIPDPAVVVVDQEKTRAYLNKFLEETNPDNPSGQFAQATNLPAIQTPKNQQERRMMLDNFLKETEPLVLGR